MKTALVPGSFDPITLGHISIIKRASELFDRIIVCVMLNSQKEYLFSLKEREELVREAISEISNAEVDSHDGMLWQYAEEKGVCAIVKGVRNAVDTEYEIIQAEFNKEKYPQAQTLLLPAEKGFEALSSTEVRNLAAKGEVQNLAVTENVKNALVKKYGGM